MFWFAWTNYPSIHWIVSIIATAPFGFGMVLVFLSIMNYLIDAYVIYAGMSFPSDVQILVSGRGFRQLLLNVSCFDSFRPRR